MQCVCVQFQQYKFTHRERGRENMKKEHPFSQFGTKRTIAPNIICSAQHLNNNHESKKNTYLKKEAAYI